MARSVPSFTWKNGFREPGLGEPWMCGGPDKEVDGHRLNGLNQPSKSNYNGASEAPHYFTPPSAELLTSTVHNSIGLNVLRTWPTLYNGTNTPHDIPQWWNPRHEVDVLICGAGPSGLQIALSLARQGVSFRIIDKAAAPLIAGRADGVQPRFLETLHSWGLATEVHEEGPLIERTAIYKDGKKLFFDHSHQSDSRYRGLHIITQGQIERIYIRDLLRHRHLVERRTVITDFNVESDTSATAYPVEVQLKNEKSGTGETVRAKFLVGSDGAASMIRKRLDIPFDGVSTDIYWGILDCIFQSDYPHAWVFGSVISSKHGGCVIIPREDGYIRLYTQLDTSSAGDIARSRQANTEALKESGGQVDVTTITAEEVLAQANKIFAPYTLEFAAPLSWFAIWKISERVARSFSSKDCRVHLVGDAAHVHSVMGAFGLNASIMDSANLAWKIGLCAQNLAKLSVLGPSYDHERRAHAHRIIRASGSYLRFVCNSEFPLAGFDAHSAQPTPLGAVDYVPGQDVEFIREFFSTNGKFLLGIDAPYHPNPISPSSDYPSSGSSPIAPRNGVRAPNPRVCLSIAETGYLYDVLKGACTIHLVIFASDMQGPVSKTLARFGSSLSSRNSFYNLYGGSTRFNLVLVTTNMPKDAQPLLAGKEFKEIRELCRVVYDDRAPDESAHTCYEVDHAQGAIVVVRPDLWIGTSVFLKDADKLAPYFDEWLIPM